MSSTKLLDFVNDHIKIRDIYIPAMILFLINNKGKGTKNQIAKLIYIFEHKKSVEEYEEIVEKMAAYILKEYGIVEEKEEYHLTEWPLKNIEYQYILKKCMYSLDGFFIPISQF